VRAEPSSPKARRYRLSTPVTWRTDSTWRPLRSKDCSNRCRRCRRSVGRSAG